MDCIVAAATGALKGINLRDNSFTNLSPIKSLTPKQDEITSMIWSGPEQSDVLAAVLDRSLKLYDTQTCTFEAMYKITGGEGAVQGLHCLENEKIISCVESGQINVWEESGESYRTWETGEGVKMRLYDPRAQRRPVKKIPFMDVPITAVSLCYRDNHVLAANSIGEMGLFDLRSKSKLRRLHAI
ncbi:hypothetical protein OESDEN_13330 [Oesophagostomum dentatum]|uniref:WD domain, G-beta repeat protein n=1 Tax=Oesophagostomum dentatum TaxID=61180 RepID=A0A0B1STP5_OESDE|nr:hypothetical protein OESDEN_13330 [Oesophagostomum dentatum]